MTTISIRSSPSCFSIPWSAIAVLNRLSRLMVDSYLPASKFSCAKYTRYPPPRDVVNLQRQVDQLTTQLTYILKQAAKGRLAKPTADSEEQRIRTELAKVRALLEKSKTAQDGRAQ